MVSFTSKTKANIPKERRQASEMGACWLGGYICKCVAKVSPLPSSPLLPVKINLLCLFHSLNHPEKHFFCWLKQLHLLWELEGCGHFSFSFVLSYAFLINRKNIKCIFSMEVQHFHRLTSCDLRCWSTSQSHEMKIHQEKIYLF